MSLPQIPYLTGHSASVVQHHAARTASNSAAHLLAYLATLPQSQPVTLLDIGCGSGTITASLVSHLPPGSSITALDASAEILTSARAHAVEKGVIQSIEFVQGDIYKLPFENGTFDFVHVSMVLTHLSEPVKAISEMHRVVKKTSTSSEKSENHAGGVISLREPDMKVWSFHPYSNTIHSFQRVLCDVQERNGGHLDAAQKLLSWALSCEGVTRDMVRCSASAWCFATREDRAGFGGSMRDRCVEGDMKEMAIREGMRTEKDFEEMIKAWDEWINAEDGWLGLLCGEVLMFL